MAGFVVMDHLYSNRMDFVKFTTVRIKNQEKICRGPDVRSVGRHY